MKDAAAVFKKLQAISAAEFRDLRRQMPEELRRLGIVYTQKQFEVKPLSIPIEAIQKVVKSQSPHTRLSKFGKLLKQVDNGTTPSPFEEPKQDEDSPLNLFTYTCALYAISVCVCICKTSLRN